MHKLLAAIGVAFLLLYWYRTHGIVQLPNPPDRIQVNSIEALSDINASVEHPTTIRVSSSPGQQPSFSSLGHLESSIRKVWEEAEGLIEQRALTLFEHWFEDDSRRLFELPEGIPGTGISTAEEARSLQAYLDCFSSNGKWVYSPDGSHLNGTSLPVPKHSPVLAPCDKAYYKALRAGSISETSNDEWAVRPSLKWYWKPSDTCRKLLKTVRMGHASASDDQSLVSRKTLCTYLRHKNILLIGDSPTHYLLHDLLLDWTSTRPLTCYGDLYCKEHAICPDELVENEDVRQQWDGDVHVFDSLPDPPGRDGVRLRSDNLPTTQTPASQTRGTVLRYRRADSMFLNSSPSHVRHQPAFVHPHTGVRDINMYSVADARRSDVTILYKAPIAYPRVSKTGSAVSQRMLKLVTAVEDSNLPISDSITKLVEMATVATTEVWLPEIVESLRALKAPPAPPDSLVIYRSGWNMQESCSHSRAIPLSFSSESKNVQNHGNQPLPSPGDLGQILFASFANSANYSAFGDLQAAFYNVQNVLQNGITRKLVAPRLGIPYINLDDPTRLWTAGFVGGAGAVQAEKPSGQLPAAQKRPQDCLRMCLPSPGLSLETFFLGSLEAIFDWGWGGHARSKTWVGDKYVPLRERRKEYFRHVE